MKKEIMYTITIEKADVWVGVLNEVYNNNIQLDGWIKPIKEVTGTTPEELFKEMKTAGYFIIKSRFI